MTSFASSTQDSQFFTDHVVTSLPDSGFNSPLQNAEQGKTSSQSSADLSVDVALSQAQAMLQQFGGSEHFETGMVTAFGENYDGTKARDFFSNLSLFGSDVLPNIELVEGDSLNHAYGVYAQATDTVYLSRQFAQQATVDQLTGLVLEEIGHALDARINSVDAAGDEGDIFLRIVQGETIAEATLTALRQEDDSMQVVVGDRLLSVEADNAPVILPPGGYYTAQLGNQTFEIAKGTDHRIYLRSDNGSWQAIGGATEDMPAIAAFNDKLVISVRGTDNRIWMRSSNDGQTWNNWKQSGGATPSAPSLAVLGNRLYQTVRGTSDKIWVRSSTDGESWGQWRQASGGTPNAVATIAYNGKLYQSVRSSQNQVYLRSSQDGSNWNEWSLQAGEATQAPQLSLRDGKLVQTLVNGENQLVERTSVDGVVWSGLTSLGEYNPVPVVAVTGILEPEGGHPMVQMGNADYAIARDGAGKLYVRRDGGSWEQISGKTNDAPAIAALGNKLVISVRGTDSRIWMRTSDDGQNWNNWSPVPGATPSAPALATFGNHVFQTVRGTDNKIYTRISNDGEQWGRWTEQGGRTGEAPQMFVRDGELIQRIQGLDGQTYERNSDGSGWSGWVVAPEDPVTLPQGTPDLVGRLQDNGAPIASLFGFEDRTFDVDFLIRNLGDGDAGASKVGFYLSHDYNISTSEDYFLGSLDIPALDANSDTQLFSHSLTLPSFSDEFWSAVQFQPGSGVIGLVVDMDNAVAEADESNNQNYGNDIGKYFDTGSLEIFPYYQYYEFKYSYGNGDYYLGHGFDTEGRYQARQVLPDGITNSTGQYGQYEILTVENKLVPSNIEFGKSFVTQYFDGDSSGQLVDVASAVGESGLGSENGYLIAGDTKTYFGNRKSEADLAPAELGESLGTSYAVPLVPGEFHEYENGAFYENGEDTYAIVGDIYEAFHKSPIVAVLGEPVNNEFSETDTPLSEWGPVRKQDFKNGYIFTYDGVAFVYNKFGQQLNDTSAQWKVEYFNNKDLQGSPVLTNYLGEQIAFSQDWQESGPAGVSDEFSARYTSKKYLEPGTYRIQTHSDDGIRVKVNGNTVIDDWEDQGFSPNAGVFSSSGEFIDLEVLYYENGGFAAIDFDIAPVKPKVDFDGDGQADILWRHVNSGELHSWIMDGTTRTTSHINKNDLGADWEVGGVGDINNDGKADIVWRNKTSGAVKAWLLDGLENIVSQVDMESPDLGWSLQGLGDLNNDGKTDIVWRHQNASLVAWFMDGPTNRISHANLESPDLSWKFQGMGDLNNDGKTDILWRHDSKVLHSWIMDGPSNVIGRINMESPGYDWQVEGIDDYDGDGKTDILWRHDSTVVKAWSMDGPSDVIDRPTFESPDASWEIQGGGNHIHAPNQTPPANGYLPSLKNISTDNWDIYSGDNTYFDPPMWGGEVDERHKTSDEIKQVYSDLSKAVLGQRYRMTAGYLYDKSYHAGYGKWHAGIDLGAGAGTPVKALTGGTVAWVWSSASAGSFVSVRDASGKQWVYGHLQNHNGFYAGKSVAKGASMGQIGNQSGANHLHLEVRTGNQSTGGAHADQNLVRNATMSPLQAFWELKQSETPPPSGGSTPSITHTGTVVSMSVSLRVRDSATTSSAHIRSVAPGTSLKFDGWKTGGSYTKLHGGTDNRWYRIEGTDDWVAAAYINGGIPSNLPNLGAPVTAPPPSTTFTSTVVSMSLPLRVRDRATTSSTHLRSIDSGTQLTFDGWSKGGSYQKLDGSSDNRWYRIQGTDDWVAVGYINGSIPSSLPQIVSASPTPQTASLSDALRFTLRWEGGYVNHPSDPGGATNKGITQSVYNSYRQSLGQGIQDVRYISDGEVHNIYEQRYWISSGSPNLTNKLATAHFDASVNHGPGNSSWMLRDAQAGGGSELEQVARYINIRRQFYRDIVTSRPSQSVFLNGWMNRMNDLENYLLS